VVAVTVILPLFIPKQDVGNVLTIALTPDPVVTLIATGEEVHPLASPTTIV
jgi:hypothetical protein